MKLIRMSVVVLFNSLLLISCSEVKRQVAIDELVGTYYGKPILVLQWSKLNIGIDDERMNNNESEFLIITKDEQDNLFLKFDDGMLVKLNNIDMAQNGSIFNIPNQSISLNSEGVVLRGNINGLGENLFGESKCDGFYDSEKNALSFSFAGTVKVSDSGFEYDVPIAVGYYGFTKQK